MGENQTSHTEFAGAPKSKRIIGIIGAIGLALIIAVASAWLLTVVGPDTEKSDNSPPVINPPPHAAAAPATQRVAEEGQGHRAGGAARRPSVETRGGRDSVPSPPVREVAPPQVNSTENYGVIANHVGNVQINNYDRPEAETRR